MDPSFGGDVDRRCRRKASACRASVEEPFSGRRTMVDKALLRRDHRSRFEYRSGLANTHHPS
jgi:hypothetical protein